MSQRLADIEALATDTNKEGRILIEKAYDTASKYHHGQFRKSGEPYFSHVYATAKNLADLGMSAEVIAAGLLHDILEDTEMPEEELEREFGADILKLVKGVTKLGTIKYKGVERNVENLRKFFVSMAEDLRILVIKLADRLHNIETLEHVDPSKQKRIALETLEVYAPLANRLSMGLLKNKLQDGAFKYAYPKEYQEVSKLLAERKDTKEKYLMEIKDALEAILKKEKIKATIDYRQKHIYSLWKKLQKYDMDMGKIYDIIAMRVKVETVTDCYHVLGLIHGAWTPVPGRIKDYIATPKKNGYRSLHTTVFTGTGGIVEIQIRTHQMDRDAENGFAAHFSYKETGIKEAPKQYDWVDQLRSLQHLHKEIDNPDQFVSTVKMDFFKDHVFVFTPKGDIIDLPEDSSVIDFAYAIHTDIGNHAQGAKINGKNSSLHTKLKNNDIVEVQVNKKILPSAKWLLSAKTSLARKQINAHLKEHSLLSKFLSFGQN
jgi:GTP diphosphokinase / guanosine-3',5'-bis(diphosphate) 3'-diphosphatase